MTATDKQRKARVEMPDNLGRYGDFGGIYAPETLMPAIRELDEAYRDARNDPEFQKELIQGEWSKGTPRYQR